MFVLKKVLPDVLVLMDEPAFTGCVLRCRLVGVIEGQELSDKKKVRDDRLVAVERDNRSYATTEHIDELGKAFVTELEAFFVNYHSLSSKRYQILGARGPREAYRRLDGGRKAVRKR